MSNIFLESSSPPLKLNALAPLRLPGIAEALRENKGRPEEVERLARELDELVPHIFEMLIAEGERLDKEEIK
jgi:predicted transcriptional regulator